MTIPDDVLHRAAEAMSADLNKTYCEVWDVELALHDAALPILRDAIRAELVEEIIADMERINASVKGYAGMDLYSPMIRADYLRSFLPESEPQP